MELKPLFKDIANAIREKDGTTDSIKAADFPGRIRGIRGGGGIALASIAITRPPNKTFYKSGEQFDPAGMEVVATYSNGAALAVSSYTVVPDGPIQDGQVQMIVRYTEGGSSAEAAQPITVVARPTALRIDTPPAKTAYQYGESFDPAGLAVSAVYSDGSSKPVEGFTADAKIFDELGEFEVAVGYTEDGVTVETAVGVTVGRAVLEALPTQKGSLTYSGDEQQPEWDGLDSDKLTLGGTTLAVNVGSYEATVTPTGFYEWPDGTRKPRPLSWSIGKAAGSVSVSPASVTLDSGHLTQAVTVTRAGDGAISAKSSNTGVATVSVAGNIVTISHVNQASGTATITVNVAAGTNYTAASGTVTVEAAFQTTVTGTLTLNPLTAMGGKTITSTTALNLGKPIRELKFRLSAKMTNNIGTATIANISGSWATVTESRSGASGESFVWSSNTNTYGSIAATIPKLTGSSSVTVTLSCDLMGNKDCPVTGSISYEAIVGG